MKFQNEEKKNVETHGEIHVGGKKKPLTAVLWDATRYQLSTTNSHVPIPHTSNPTTAKLSAQVGGELGPMGRPSWMIGSDRPKEASFI